MSAQVRGRPARHARRLARRAQIQMLAAATLALSGVAALVGGWPVPDAVAGLALIGGVSAAQPARVRWLQARAGVRSEDRVARALTRCGAASIVHGADLATGARKSGDVDHVVLGPMIAAVETKTGRGVVRVEGDQIRVGKRTLPGQPLRQARRNAQLLSQALGAEAAAVLCVVDMSGRPVQVNGVTICSCADLGAVLAGLPRRLNAASAKQAGSRIPLAD